MLVCRHPSLLFRVHPAGREIFFYYFNMEKKALILIYLTWFSSSSPRPISCVYLYCNVHAAIINLTYFNPHSLQLANEQLHGTSFPRLSCLRRLGWVML